MRLLFAAVAVAGRAVPVPLAVLMAVTYAAALAEALYLHAVLSWDFSWDWKPLLEMSLGLWREGEGGQTRSALRCASCFQWK